MLKKNLIAVLLALSITTAYADAPVMINVTGDMNNQPFNVDNKQWGYQFNNSTGKILTFVATVSSKSQGAINLQCWHGLDPVENYTVKPGETSLPCVTNDAIRLVTSANNKDLPAMGTYTITVGEK